MPLGEGAEFALRYQGRTPEEARALALRMSATARLEDAKQQRRELCEKMLRLCDRVERILEAEVASRAEARAAKGRRPRGNRAQIGRRPWIDRHARGALYRPGVPAL